MKGKYQKAISGKVLIVAIILLLGPTLGVRFPMTLEERIDQLIALDDTGPAFWGVYIQDAATGEVLYSRNADKAYIPASNQKLITTAIALRTLGSDYRYQTPLYFNGTIDGTVMKGDLIIRGSGDPTFGSVQAPGGDPLREWARGLANMGVTRFEGRIIGDDDVFDNRPYAEGWDVDYLLSQASRSLGISTGGLSYHDNVVAVELKSAGVGSAPIYTMRPAPFLEVTNRAKTSGRSRGIALDVNRAIGTEEVTLTGSIPRSYRGTINVPVSNPTTFTLMSLSTHLQSQGIEVSATLHDIDDLGETINYENAKPLFVYLSPPLTDIITIINKESNNFYADQLFKTFAWGGSNNGGERRAKEVLAAMGVDVTDVSIKDGSGLSRKDLITPRVLGTVLTSMYNSPYREAYLSSLPGGGEPRTTMDYRLRGFPIRAKTGSLEFVRSLSGYAETPDGRTLVFSFLINNYTVPAYQITQTIDRVVMTLAMPGAV